MPEESEVEGGEYQDDADVGDQALPKTISEEQDVDGDDDGCHYYHIKHASYSRAGFRGDRHFGFSFMAQYSNYQWCGVKCQAGGGGYQSRLNSLLRSVMLRDLESKRKRA
jgi:hypothetical protein